MDDIPDCLAVGRCAHSGDSHDISVIVENVFKQIFLDCASCEETSNNFYNRPSPDGEGYIPGNNCMGYQPEAPNYPLSVA